MNSSLPASSQEHFTHTFEVLVSIVSLLLASTSFISVKLLIVHIVSISGEPTSSVSVLRIQREGDLLQRSASNCKTTVAMPGATTWRRGKCEDATSQRNSATRGEMHDVLAT
eukprot:763303-Hanusia_phi.AAC.10